MGIEWDRTGREKWENTVRKVAGSNHAVMLRWSKSKAIVGP